MNLRYNRSLGRFEAEFQDFQGDLAAVKAAGFKPDTSSGAWVWHAAKIPVIEKLRANKPPSGLTITPEGLLVYNELKENFDRNALIKAEAAKIEKARKKAAKEKQKEEVASETFNFPEGKIFIDKEDLPYKEPFVPNFVRPEPPALRCITCQVPVYVEFELSDPPICIWCEKTLFDPHKKS